MAKLPPIDLSRWFKVPAEGSADVWLQSDVDFWVSHWDHSAGRSRRCGGSACALCGEVPASIRYVCFVLDEQGVGWLLELRDGQRRAIDSANVGGSCAGAVLRLLREGTAITAVYVGRRPIVQERPIRKLVESLGLPAMINDWRNPLAPSEGKKHDAPY